MAAEPVASLVLASASPRRRVLLERAGLDFEVRPSAADETLDPAETDPDRAARELALRKARAVAAPLKGSARWVVGADTIVALGAGAATRFLGKPEDAGDARRMLSSLSGTTHRVVTGVVVIRASDGEAFLDAETTRVTMRTLAPDEVEAYVASGEWRDKAGGYAIQESADAFVTALEGGGFDNVVGLPVARTLRLLERAGAALAGPSGPA